MNVMHPESKASRVLRVFEDGPGTMADVVAETGFTPHVAGCHVFNLVQRGKLRKTAARTKSERGHVSRWMYYLPKMQCAPFVGAGE